MDVNLALALARNGRANGHAVAALRERLITAVTALEPKATAYAAALDDPSIKDAHTGTIGQALALAASGGRAGADRTPAEGLSLLGKAADVMGRLAYGHRRQAAHAEGRPLPC